LVKEAYAHLFFPPTNAFSVLASPAVVTTSRSFGEKTNLTRVACRARKAGRMAPRAAPAGLWASRGGPVRTARRNEGDRAGGWKG